jgi:hypothetical protein
MAGGTTTILLKHFDESHLTALDQFIRERGEVQESRLHFWDLHIFSGLKTGRKKAKMKIHPSEKRPFVICFFERQAEFDDDPDNQTLIKTLGFSNTCSIDVAAMCHEPIDQFLQAELTATLAEMFGGLIYLNGVLLPNFSAEWSLEQVKAFARSIEGALYFAEYTLENGQKWANQLVDATYLRNWMQHPEFGMPK